MKQAMRSQTEISAKLLFCFAGLIGLFLVLSYASLTAIGNLGEFLDHAVNADARRLQIVGDPHSGVEEMRADSTKVEMSLVNMHGKLTPPWCAPGTAASEVRLAREYCKQ